MRIMMEFFIQKTTSELLSKQHISQATIIKAFLQIQRRRSVYESFLKNKIADLFGKAQFPQSFWRIANLLKKKVCNFIKKGFRHWCFPMNLGGTHPGQLLLQSQSFHVTRWFSMQLS